ncbi:disease resistance protein RPM1-like [Syzygium oleosum]|uniref:disease resistance protein RPM1-like n=1 Tax=Syzygium oleosum TaxID=219896 RepID=UPI0011D2C33D|nr:disease resistance protein RPM1-like [Syzygium oleosum]
MASLAVEATLRLVEIVSSLILEEINRKKDVKEDIDCIMRWLKTMRAFLRDQEGTQGNEGHQDKVHQIRDLAYDIEDAFDDFMFHVPHHVHTHMITKFAHGATHFPQQRVVLHKMSSRIKKIRTKIQNFGYLEPLRTGNTTSGESGTSGVGSEDHLAHRVVEEDDIVGFEGHVECIRDQLLSGEPKLSTISIAGPPGSGKTVLAKQVFECKRVQGHFDFHAWLRVSPSFKREEILWSILTQFFPGMDGSVLIKGVAVREIFSKYMQQKRFIVVLDDIWRMQDWEKIVNELQIGSSGSRILITSRNSGVGESCVGYPNYVHQLNGLPWKEAFNLFGKKAFWSRNGICPPELEDWSEKIIKKCEGLPFAVIAAGNLLSKKGQIPHEWKKLHDSLGANLPVIGSILLPSYKYLPSNLRSCFLYFSIFPEDYSIQRQRLIRLWIAEGFVKEARNTSLEETAENYLNELVQRNLVDVTAKDIEGRVRSCRVLNIVHEFIIDKAEEENFVGSASERSSSSQGRIRRLSAQTDIRTNVELSQTLRHVRSAFMLGRGKFPSLKFFQLLRILDMQGAPLEDFPNGVKELVLLKYLSFQETNIKTVPKYDVKNYMTFDGAKGVEMLSGRGALSNIQKLSLVMATTELIEKLDGMIHLRKLGLINLKSKDGRKVCESIQKMEHLSTLDLRAESGDHLELDHIQIKPGFVFLRHLYLKGQLQKLPKWVSSLESLIKVCLKWSRSNINPLQALQDLPNLMDLNMVDAFTGQTLEFKANTFRKLKMLQIEQFSELSIVDVQVNAMPALEKLTFRKCEKLDTLPFGIKMLTNLQELLLYDMNGEFIDRLRKNSEDLNLVRHVRVIRSYTLSKDQYWLPQNLS